MVEGRAQEKQKMSNRMCVVFLAVASAANPNPKAFTVTRGCFKSFAELRQSCIKNLPSELMHPQGQGHVFVGRENDYWIKNPTRNSPAAKLWQGTMKSGSFDEFLKPHLSMFFPETAEAAVTA
jgi:hypothetical protein